MRAEGGRIRWRVAPLWRRRTTSHVHQRGVLPETSSLSPPKGAWGWEGEAVDPGTAAGPSLHYLPSPSPRWTTSVPDPSHRVPSSVRGVGGRAHRTCQPSRGNTNETQAELPCPGCLQPFLAPNSPWGFPKGPLPENGSARGHLLSTLFAATAWAPGTASGWEGAPDKRPPEEQLNEQMNE